MRKLTTQEDAHKLQQDLISAQTMFTKIRQSAGSVDGIIARKLFQAALIPLAALLDYITAEGEKKLRAYYQLSGKAAPNPQLNRKENPGEVVS